VRDITPHRSQNEARTGVKNIWVIPNLTDQLIVQGMWNFAKFQNFKQRMLSIFRQMQSNVCSPIGMGLCLRNTLQAHLVSKVKPPIVLRTLEFPIEKRRAHPPVNQRRPQFFDKWIAFIQNDL
jgi:hypothetical protein